MKNEKNEVFVKNYSQILIVSGIILATLGTIELISSLLVRNELIKGIRIFSLFHIINAIIIIVFGYWYKENMRKRTELIITASTNILYIVTIFVQANMLLNSNAVNTVYGKQNLLVYAIMTSIMLIVPPIYLIYTLIKNK